MAVAAADMGEQEEEGREEEREREEERGQADYVACTYSRAYKTRMHRINDRLRSKYVVALKLFWPFP